MSSRKVEYDDDMIKEIDDQMGWVEPDGSSPSKTARDKGLHCKFMDGPLSSTAWGRPGGVWSVCVLEGIETTLLAKSFPALERLYRKLRERQEEARDWKTYYSDLWERRYLKWCCRKDWFCMCQLCRIRRANGTTKKA